MVASTFQGVVSSDAVGIGSAGLLDLIVTTVTHHRAVISGQSPAWSLLLSPMQLL